MTPQARAACDDAVEATERYYRSFDDKGVAFRLALQRAWAEGAKWAIEHAQSEVDLALNT